MVPGRLFRSRRLFRVDLHGISSYGAGKERTLIRWEWVEAIEVDRGSVVVRSAHERITLPGGCFGMGPDSLARELEHARGIADRPEVIGRLGAGNGG